MKWGYTQMYVEISMPGYVEEYLHQFNHKTPKKPYPHPYLAHERKYGADA